VAGGLIGHTSIVGTRSASSGAYRLHPALCGGFWDKRHGIWRVSENDPDSGLYAVSRDADTVIRYMAANS
jgi:hypothetical protein